MLTLRCNLAALLLTSLSLVAISAGFPAAAQTRLALVIGNSAYQAVPALPNPANDAKAVAAFLGGAGFEVTSVADLTQADMRRAIAEFTVKVAGAGSDSVALVYYAGHGVQIDGENFLVPVDAKVQRESDVPLQAVRLADVMNALSSVPSRMRIVMLDACRNNPFSEINRTSGRGLAIVDAPAGSIVSYSTAPGMEAEDGAGENSPYTTALLSVAKEPGLPIEQAFKRTRLAVNQATAGRQTPWESSSLALDFSFVPAASAGSQAKAPTPNASAQGSAAGNPVKTVDAWRRELRSLPAQKAYEIVITENSLEAYEAFIALYKEPSLAPRIRGLLDRRKEMIAWYIAALGNSADSFQAFLASYPSSDLTLTATRLLDRARSRSLVAPAPQLANLSPATPACSCSTPPARKATPRRASNSGPAPVYYPPPPPPPPVRFGIGVGRGGYGGRPDYPPPPSRGGPPVYQR